MLFLEVKKMLGFDRFWRRVLGSLSLGFCRHQVIAQGLQIHPARVCLARACVLF